ncbi:Propionyl-CoA carboxylase alpha chain-like protein, partial [Dinothrombium tinctorium]
MADEAHAIGPSPSSHSYLNIEKIIEVAKTSAADALHPGYGLLSENPHFAKLLAESNITFIGPNYKAIKSMGDKIECKKIARNAGVNTVPGFIGIVKSVNECVQLANEIGYPVMIKAAAGGGGKGMRVAWNDNEAFEAFKYSSEEAASSFNDERILIEKFISNARHIEIQIIADKFGNVVHLNERECSIQRRNQKIIEESPSVFVDEKLRQHMGSQAVALAKAVSYDSVGTVEFLVDSNKQFYFLEMNTRLQVEHPVTELTVGIDLVEQMIKIANGCKLELKQTDVLHNGWAIEARICAEDPYKNFGVPSIGRIRKYREPLHIKHVRCDSGVKEGSEISVYYDALVCKLITHGSNRKEAISTMISALDSFVLRGVRSNVPLLRDIMTQTDFLTGKMSTNFLQKTYPNGFHGKQLDNDQLLKLCSIAAFIFLRDQIRSRIFLNAEPNYNTLYKFNYCSKNWHFAIVVKDFESYEKVFANIQIKENLSDFRAEIGASVYYVSSNFSFSSPTISLKVNDEEITVQLFSVGNGTGNIAIQYLGTIFEIRVTSEIVAKYYELMPKTISMPHQKTIVAPMPALVKAVLCKVGEKLTEGQEVCIIEAMKMHNSLHASSPGIVKHIHCKTGDTVEENQ